MHVFSCPIRVFWRRKYTVQQRIQRYKTKYLGFSGEYMVSDISFDLLWSKNSFMALRVLEFLSLLALHPYKLKQKRGFLLNSHPPEKTITRKENTELGLHVTETKFLACQWASFLSTAVYASIFVLQIVANFSLVVKLVSVFDSICLGYWLHWHIITICIFPTHQRGSSHS